MISESLLVYLVDAETGEQLDYSEFGEILTINYKVPTQYDVLDASSE
jgi:hypothetical protein